MSMTDFDDHIQRLNVVLLCLTEFFDAVVTLCHWHRLLKPTIPYIHTYILQIQITYIYTITHTYRIYYIYKNIYQQTDIPTDTYMQFLVSVWENHRCKKRFLRLYFFIKNTFFNVFLYFEHFLYFERFLFSSGQIFYSI